MGGQGSGRRPISAIMRERHQQLFEEAKEAFHPPENGFLGAQFVGWIHPTGMKFNQSGGLDLTFGVPYEFVEYALVLREAFMTGIPLSIDVQLWKPAQEAFEAILSTDEFSL